MSATLTPLQEGWKENMMDNYGMPMLGLVRGKGSVVVDEEGKEYLDLLSGLAVNCLGHQHPAIIKAVTDQLNTLGHVSNFFVHPQEIKLAKRVISAFDSEKPSRILFCNSGAEANEIAFKLARLTKKRRILAHEDGFHGRTMGALAMTGQPSKREPFAPMPGGVEFFPFNDLNALQELINKDPQDVAAVIVEPIMGEAGVVVPDDGYLRKIRELTNECGALMIVDEVQTGMGRCGDLFVSRAQGVVPDVVTLAKGLAGGLPIGACIATNKAADYLTPGSHGTTFGGNPYACAAANAVLDTFENEHILEHVREMEQRFIAGIKAIDSPVVKNIRGKGLLIGVELTKDIAKNAMALARDKGVIINAARPAVLRIAPPLIITSEEVDQALDVLSDVFTELVK